MLSPIGEPLAMLPPRVPVWRTGGPAKRRAISTQPGSRATSAAKASARLAAAPITMPPSGLRVMACSSGTAPSHSRSPGSRRALVMDRPRSVAPATRRASGAASRAAASSARLRGARKRRPPAR